MQPNRYVTLNMLPVTPTGKVDRAALPEPVWGRHKSTTVAPRTDVERRLAAIWREVLSIPPDIALGVHDDFFALGGHSLTATQLIARIRAGLARRGAAVHGDRQRRRSPGWPRSMSAGNRRTVTIPLGRARRPAPPTLADDG